MIPIFLVDSPAPTSPNDMVVHTGPDYIIVDWKKEEDEGSEKNEDGEEWAAEYVVTVIPIEEEDLAGNSTAPSNLTQVVTVTVPSNGGVPPLRVAGLDPETEYEVVVETRLGPGFTSTVRLGEVKTTANDSQMPREIIGVR